MSLKRAYNQIEGRAEMTEESETAAIADFDAEHEDIQRSIARLVGKIRARAAVDAKARVAAAFDRFIQEVGVDVYGMEDANGRSAGLMLEQAREIIVKEVTAAEENSVLAGFIRRVSETMKGENGLSGLVEEGKNGDVD